MVSKHLAKCPGTEMQQSQNALSASTAKWTRSGRGMERAKRARSADGANEKIQSVEEGKTKKKKVAAKKTPVESTRWWQQASIEDCKIP